MDPIRLEPVALAAGEAVACDAANARPRTWNQVAKQGEFHGHHAGPFAITAATYSEILANFAALGRQPLPVDMDHATELAGGPAVAWVVDLAVRGAELWALFEWVDEDVRAQVRAGQWGYLSPAIVFKSRDPVSGKAAGARMTSVALTTQPFLRGMQPVAARDAAAEPDPTPVDAAPVGAADPPAPAAPGSHHEATTMSEHFKVIALAAKLPAEAGEAEIVSEIRSRESRIHELEREAAHWKNQAETYALADKERRESAALEAVDALGEQDPHRRADLIALYHADEPRFRRLFMQGGAGAASHRVATLTGRVAPRGGVVRSATADAGAGRSRGELIVERARQLMSAKPGLSYEEAAYEADAEFTREAKRSLALVGR
jgi:hypothetical protein